MRGSQTKGWYREVGISAGRNLPQTLAKESRQAPHSGAIASPACGPTDVNISTFVALLDVSVFARLAPGNETILDYFCVPTSKDKRVQITVSPQTSPPRNAQQFDDLGFLRDFARWGRR
jgi:hypothetical protein